MEEIKREDIDKIIDDLGANYREEDKKVLEEILEEVNSIAFDISNNKNKEKLFPYVKRAVKAEYIARGAEGLTSKNEGSVSSQFVNIIENLEKNIIKARLRRIK